MSKKVTAEFPGIDDAELVMRMVRRRFDGIQRIKIQYRNGRHAAEYQHLPPAMYTNGIFGGTYYPDYAYDDSVGYTSYLPAAKPVSGFSDTETAERHESMVEVLVKDIQADKIAGYLRALGGLHVTIH